MKIVHKKLACAKVPILQYYEHSKWVVPDKVFIYKRPDSPKWHMRLKVPDGTGYIRRSTKERDPHLAEEVARQEFATLSYKVANNLEIEKYDFVVFSRFVVRAFAAQTLLSRA